MEVANKAVPIYGNLSLGVTALSLISGLVLKQRKDTDLGVTG